MEILNDMALYVEMVRAKSFRRAAEALGMQNSTLSRRIAGLEQSIGLRLLHRTTRAVEPTEAGLLYYERCRRIIDEARIAHEQLGQALEQPTGALRVSLPGDFAITVMAPILTEFTERHPGIIFELDLTSRRVDLVSEPVDVAIRTGHQPDSGLIARKARRAPASRLRLTAICGENRRAGTSRRPGQARMPRLRAAAGLEALRTKRRLRRSRRRPLPCEQHRHAPSACRAGGGPCGAPAPDHRRRSRQVACAGCSRAGVRTRCRSTP